MAPSGRTPRSGIQAPLGELEQAVMEEIWAGGEGLGHFAADLQQRLAERHPVALTTVLTTLDRLYDKGILRRQRIGKAYRYEAAVSEAELERRIVRAILDDLIARFPRAVAVYFAQQRPGRTAPEASNERDCLTDLARCLGEMIASAPDLVGDEGGPAAPSDDESLS